MARGRDCDIREYVFNVYGYENKIIKTFSNECTARTYCKETNDLFEDGLVFYKKELNPLYIDRI